MAENGYCPSGRLFEAAACGAAILSDNWPGLDTFFEPGREIIVANQTDDAVEALDKSPEELRRMARAARERTLEEHTADVRARQFEAIIEGLPAFDTRVLKAAQAAEAVGVLERAASTLWERRGSRSASVCRQ